jgi:hypothetical protein
MPRGKHRLPSRLVISLTSYPSRFPTLALTLKCLLTQSLEPDAIVLWVADKDMDAIPDDILRLKASGLTIRSTTDLRSYKKIIPSLLDFPDAYIVTADDDAYYGRNWLKELVDAYEPGKKMIVCHRATLIALGKDGLPAPYLDWKPKPPGYPLSNLTFPTGVGGILYEPNIFHADVTNASQFETLCPTADDIWLYFMAGRNGACWKLARRSSSPHVWLDSQAQALMSENVGNCANDRQFRAMIDRFGFDWVRN